MPTARKLKSGSWHCSVFSHYEWVDGKKKRKYESFTCSTPGRKGKAECERMASEWQYNSPHLIDAPVCGQRVGSQIASQRPAAPAPDR